MRPRTPIVAHLAHHSTQAALDAARHSEVENLISRDGVEYLIRETARSDRWSIPKSLPQIISRLVWGPVFWIIGLLVAFGERYDRWRHPERYTAERDIRERPPVDFIRETFAATWVEAIDVALDDSEQVALGDDLFPIAFPARDYAHADCRSWRDLVANYCGHDLDARTTGILMDAFALRARERVGHQGQWEIPLGIVIRKDGTRYLAERRSA